MRGATRWYRGLSTEAPPEDLFRPSEYDVAPIDERSAKEFVVTHHYSRSYPNARFRFGLHGPDGLAGAAVFSRGTNDLAILNAFPGIDIRCGVELGRFVLLDGVRFNAETWFLGRCFDYLKRCDIEGIIAFSDPLPRTDTSGNVVKVGHFGAIYQAHNARPLGRSEAQLLRLMPSGRTLDKMNVTKIRNRRQGWQYSVRKLVGEGFREPGVGEDLPHWLDEQLAGLRRLRHPGNFKYGWPLTRTWRRHFDGLALLHVYPKARHHAGRSLPVLPDADRRRDSGVPPGRL